MRISHGAKISSNIDQNKLIDAAFSRKVPVSKSSSNAPAISNGLIAGQAISIKPREMILAPINISSNTNFSEIKIKHQGITYSGDFISKFGVYSNSQYNLPNQLITSNYYSGTPTLPNTFISYSGSFDAPKGVYWFGFANISTGNLGLASTTKNNRGNNVNYSSLLTSLVGTSPNFTSNPPQGLKILLPIGSNDIPNNFNDKNLDMNLAPSNETFLRCSSEAPIFYGFYE